jgi:hypothetical protein
LADLENFLAVRDNQGGLVWIQSTIFFFIAT